MFYLNGAYYNMKDKNDMVAQEEIGLDREGYISFDWFNMIGDVKRKTEFLDAIKKNCCYIYYQVVEMVLSENLNTSLRAINYLFTNWHKKIDNNDIREMGKIKIGKSQIQDAVRTLKDKVNSSIGKLSPVEKITHDEETTIRKNLEELWKDWSNYNFS